MTAPTVTSAAATFSSSGSPVDVLIFDIDDTMYPVSSGFSRHRHDIIAKFMVERLGFPTREEAMAVRNEYFRKYHSTLKGLTMADREGRLPKPFHELDLGAYWAEHCDFAGHLSPDPDFIEALRSLKDEAGLTLVAFTNSPRAYALRCLDALGVRQFFPDDRIFAVEDVMPACKPELAAFKTVLQAVGCSDPSRVVMFEDSMKNIRACRAAGIRTVLVDEGGAVGGEALLLGDTPKAADTAVDAVLRHVGQLSSMLLGLGQRRFEAAVVSATTAA